MSAATTAATSVTGGSARAEPHRFALAAPLLLLMMITALCWMYLRASPLNSAHVVSLGAVASVGLAGFHEAETTDEGRGMRWTDGAGRLELPAQGIAAHILAVTVSAPRPEAAPVPVSLRIDGAPLGQLDVSQGERRYLLLAPAAAVGWGERTLAIDSPSFTPGAGDRRTLGVVVFELSWRSVEAPGWLPVAQALAIGGATTALYLLLRRGGIPLWARLITMTLFVAILVSMRHTDPRFAHRLSALGLTIALGLLILAALLVVRPQPGDGRLPWRAWLRLHWPALLGFVVLTALMQLPVLARLTTAIPGHPGDAFEYLWKLQLFSDSLVDLHRSPIFLPELMYPAGFELASSEITPANTLLGLPLTRLFGPIVSFNLLSLASYVLSGFFTYLLIHRLGARRLAAFVGAIVFAFTVRRFFQMYAGHLPLMPTQYLALALYGLEGLLTRRRSWDGFVTALGLALATWASLYFGTTFALFMAGYALLRTGLRPFAVWATATWRPLALGAVTLVALVAPFAQPYLELREQGATLRHERIHLEVHAARPGDYLPPNPYHPLFGAWAQQLHRLDGGEHLVSLGYSAMALATLGLLVARPRRLAIALAVLMAGCFVLTLGPFLDLPGGARIPLPALFIYEHVPILDGIRVWNRVVLYLVLCMAVLAGLALNELRGRAYVAGAVVAASVLLFELAATTTFTGAGPRPVDRWLAAQPARGATIELPATPVPGGAALYYTSFQDRPSNLWYGTFAPPLFAENSEALESFPSERAARLLQRWRTAYIIIDEAALQRRAPDWAARAAQLPQLKPVYSQDGYTVYRLARGLRPDPTALQP